MEEVGEHDWVYNVHDTEDSFVCCGLLPQFILVSDILICVINDDELQEQSTLKV